VRSWEIFDCDVEGLNMDAPPVEPTDDHERTALDSHDEHNEAVVLIVDDNAMNQLVATRMLARLGYGSDIANNGREALAAIAWGSYAAVLMDCQMPEMDGYEATRQLRSIEAGTGGHLPVIAMTAAAMHGDGEACLEAGMDDYITKPVRPDSISEALERWIPYEPAAPVAGASVPDASPIVDPGRFAVLRDLDRGDGELLAAIIREYLHEGEALLASLHEALAEGDPHSIERTAQTLKGASVNIGALRLTETCKELESLGRAGALATAPALVHAATAEFEQVRTALADQVPAV
jgi:hypothetical protein